jgi:hypothetical protein
MTKGPRELQSQKAFLGVTCLSSALQARLANRLGGSAPYQSRIGKIAPADLLIKGKALFWE